MRNKRLSTKWGIHVSGCKEYGGKGRGPKVGKEGRRVGRKEGVLLFRYNFTPLIKRLGSPLVVAADMAPVLQAVGDHVISCKGGFVVLPTRH